MKIVIALALSATMALGLVAFLARMTSDPVLFFVLFLIFVAAIIRQVFVLHMIERRADEDFLQDEKHWGGR